MTESSERAGWSSNLGEIQALAEARLASWKKMNFSRRLWSRDISLWADRPTAEISNRLGWLDLPDLMGGKIDALTSFAGDVKDEGFTHAVLLGMGGSSLAPEFFQKAFGSAPGFPELRILDSTHPAAVRSIERDIDISRALFIVSSKSGTTLETLSFFRYFWNRVSGLADAPGRRFVAITDPGTPLAALAKDRAFRSLFEAPPDVGGRYSALTDFGLVPAALIGMDVRLLLDHARVSARANALPGTEGRAFGFFLGAALGEAANSRNKLTILTSPSLRAFPDWLEQLIAESLGKDGRGIVPVVDEPPIPPGDYGKDRFFVGFRLAEDQDRDLEDRLSALENLGHPVIRIDLNGLYSLGREIFGWEIAAAAAGAALGIHPFNQPDVELAKELARNVMKRGNAAGPKTKGAGEGEEIPADDAASLRPALKNWLSSARPGDYFAIQAYLPPSEALSASLRALRHALLERTKLATTSGYGPRFLHSTGQLHKGGPDEVLVLQIVDEPAENLPVPEADYSFGALIKAQALGDDLALRRKGRRVLRIGLGNDGAAGLERLRKLIQVI